VVEISKADVTSDVVVGTRAVIVVVNRKVVVITRDAIVGTRYIT